MVLWSLLLVLLAVVIFPVLLLQCSLCLRVAFCRKNGYIYLKTSPLPNNAMSLPFQVELFPSQKRYRLWFLFSFLFFGLLLITVTIAILYYRSSENIHNRIRQDYYHALEQRRFIFTRTTEVEKTLSGLQQSPLLNRFVEVSTSAARQRLIELFLFTAEDHPN